MANPSPHDFERKQAMSESAVSVKFGADVSGFGRRRSRRESTADRLQRRSPQARQGGSLFRRRDQRQSGEGIARGGGRRGGMQKELKSLTTKPLMRCLGRGPKAPTNPSITWANSPGKIPAFPGTKLIGNQPNQGPRRRVRRLPRSRSPPRRRRRVRDLRDCGACPRSSASRQVDVRRTFAFGRD